MNYPTTIAVRMLDADPESVSLEAQDLKHVGDLLDKGERAVVGIYRFDHLAVVDTVVTVTRQPNRRAG